MSKQYYTHINQTINYGLTPIDVGHNETNKWETNDNFPYYSINFVTKGTIVIEYNGNTFTAKKNDLFIIPPSINVKFYNINNENTEIYWLNFNGLNCEKIITKINFKDGYILSIQEVDKVVNTFKSFFNKIKNRNIKDISALATLYRLIEIMVYESPKNNEIFDLKPSGFQEILQKVEENKFKPTISEKEIAKSCYISCEHFSRLFIKNMGINFVSYINLERIKKASEFLETTNLSIKEISYSIGYTNTYYFCRVFKKYRILTPSQYRQKNLRSIR